MKRKLLNIITILAIVIWSLPALAGTVYQYGGINYSTGASLAGATGASTFWSTEPTWHVLNSYDTGYKNGLTNPEIMFVGNAANPGAYWAKTADYLYFRARTEYTGAVTFGSTFSDTVMVMINTNPYNYTRTIDSAGTVVDGGPDFAFSWDSIGTEPRNLLNHGLEMQVRSFTGQGSWDAVRFDDLDVIGNRDLVPSTSSYYYSGDSNAGSKKYAAGADTSGLGPDFGLYNGDGYVRTIDGVTYTPTGGSATTSTFIDFAISIAYLNNIAPQLMGNPVWNIQFGSINAANDHARIDYLAGGATLDSSITTFAGAVDTQNGTTVTPPPPPPTVPEAPTMLLLGFGLVGLAGVGRKFEKPGSSKFSRTTGSNQFSLL